MRQLYIATATATLLASPVLAQNESTLRQFFEGKTVTVKIDMPAKFVGGILID